MAHLSPRPFLDFTALISRRKCEDKNPAAKMDSEETFLVLSAKAGWGTHKSQYTHTHTTNRSGVIGSSDLNVHIAPYPEATSKRTQTNAAMHNHTHIFLRVCIHMPNDKTINSPICV